MYIDRFDLRKGVRRSYKGRYGAIARPSIINEPPLASYQTIIFYSRFESHVKGSCRPGANRPYSELCFFRFFD